MRSPLVIVLLALALPAAPARAEVAPEQRVKIMLAALGFDRTLAASDAFEITLGVFGECLAAEVLKQAEGKKINGKPITIVRATEITYAFLERAGINVLYVCDVPAEEAKILAKSAPRLGVAVLADDAGLVDSVALMGVRDQDGHPRLRLNMKMAKLAQIDFDPRILGNAEVVAE